MKHKLLLYLSFSLFSVSVVSQPSIENLRKLFFEMDRDSCHAHTIFETIKSTQYSSALLQAYAGAIEAAAAECVKGAFTKLEYFSRGKKNLEAAIEQEPKNPELRFLRFATQVNAPNFLEYDNTREDKEMILEQIPVAINNGQNQKFWRQVAGFMIDSGKLSKTEIGKLRDDPD